MLNVVEIANFLRLRLCHLLPWLSTLRRLRQMCRVLVDTLDEFNFSFHYRHKITFLPVLVSCKTLSLFFLFVQLVIVVLFHNHKSLSFPTGADTRFNSTLGQNTDWRLLHPATPHNIQKTFLFTDRNMEKLNFLSLYIIFCLHILRTI